MRIYLDHHAATPVGEAARSAMRAAEDAAWANPSSVHARGRAARALLERARAQVASAIGAAASDVVLTSGGTEACNLAVRGLGEPTGRVITTGIEHPAVTAAIAARGVEVVVLPTPRGLPPRVEDLDAALDRGASLVVIQLVNHETGTILPVAQLAERSRAHGVPLVVDATQALGKVPVDVGRLGATAVALASHKVGGPAGAGALWVARESALVPSAVGGAQERGRRAGSPDVRAMVGFGAACSVVSERLAAMPTLDERRARLERELVALGAVVNAPDGPRVATCVSVSVPRWRGAALVAALDLEGVEASSGAACSSGLEQPSPVLLAMHADEPWRASSALRLTLAPDTTDHEIEAALAVLRKVLSRTPA